MLLAGCASQQLDATPALDRYARIDIAANGAGLRAAGQLRYQRDAASFSVDFPGTKTQRLHVQADECRNDPDPACRRGFVLTGDLDVQQVRMKCYVQIRNDLDTGYAGQAAQGICTDPHGRTYTVTLAR